MLFWSLRSLRIGRWPSFHYDETAWPDSLGWAQSLAGVAFGFKVKALFIKLDWMENVSTMGFPSWSTLEDCCVSCACTQANWGATQGLSPISVPWPSKTIETYDRACKRCEVEVVVTGAVFPRLRGSMEFDRRAHGKRGRCMAVDFPELGLLRGDRLEPSLKTPTTCDFDTLAKPFKANFWRSSAETSARHRNPLMSQEIMVGPENIVVDWLHCLSLGVFQYFVNSMLFALVDSPAFSTASTRETRVQISLQRIKVMLFAWYSAEEKSGRMRNRLQDLSPGMLGETENDMITLHGGETNDFLIFCMEVLLPTHGQHLPQQASLQRCGDALCVMLRLIRGGHDNWGAAEAQDTI